VWQCEFIRYLPYDDDFDIFQVIDAAYTRGFNCGVNSHGSHQPGLREAALAVDGALAHCIANACRTNVLYCGHRCMMIPRSAESPRHRQGIVAQLTPSDEPAWVGLENT
jgi:hypothetical protein